MHWLEVQPHFNDLVVSTYGRGFWILDDITAIQQLDASQLSRPAHLFEARPAYRFLMREAPQSQPGDPAAGDNPDYGAALNLWLREAPDDSRMQIVDATGTVVRTVEPLRGLRTGLNRIMWDLREDASKQPRLRTQPLEHEHVRFDADGTRGPPEGGRVRPLAAPGNYTARIEIDGQVLETEIQVLQDPSSSVDVEEITEQIALLRALRDRTDQVTDLIDEIEIVRAQVDDIEERIGPDGARELRQAARTLDDELIELEMKLFDLRLTGGFAGQDSLRWPRQLYAKLISLAGYVGGTDERPTDQATEVFEIYERLLREHQERMEEIRSGSLVTLNQALVRAGLAPVG